MDWELAARQVLRAIRGRRSQVGFSRRLGYRSNVAADWEAGRRFPVAAEVLRAASLMDVDVPAAFARFHPRDATALSGLDDGGVAAWLEQIRGSTPIGQVAARAGRSRFSVGRWLSGESRPRLPDFLLLVDVMSGRASEWIAAMVEIEQVPAVADEHQRRVAARRLALEEPWTEAILRLLETEHFAAMPRHAAGDFARRLGIDEAVVMRALDQLVQAGAVDYRAGHFSAAAPLTIDTRASAQEVNRLKSHWARVAAERLAHPTEGDLGVYNVVSVSRADLDRIRDMHRAYYRELRSIVAASHPEQCAALINVHLIDWS